MLELPCWGMLRHAMTCHVWQTRRKTLTRHKKLSVKHIQIHNVINSAPHLQVSWEHEMSKTTNIPSIYSPVWLSLCVDCLPATGLLTLTGSLFHRGISWARAAPVTVLCAITLGMGHGEDADSLQGRAANTHWCCSHCICWILHVVHQGALCCKQVVV